MKSEVRLVGYSTSWQSVRLGLDAPESSVLKCWNKTYYRRSAASCSLGRCSITNANPQTFPRLFNGVCDLDWYFCDNQLPRHIRIIVQSHPVAMPPNRNFECDRISTVHQFGRRLV